MINFLRSHVAQLTQSISQLSLKPGEEEIKKKAGGISGNEWGKTIRVKEEGYNNDRITTPLIDNS